MPVSRLRRILTLLLSLRQHARHYGCIPLLMLRALVIVTRWRRWSLLLPWLSIRYVTHATCSCVIIILINTVLSHIATVTSVRWFVAGHVVWLPRRRSRSQTYRFHGCSSSTVVTTNGRSLPRHVRLFTLHTPRMWHSRCRRFVVMSVTLYRRRLVPVSNGLRSVDVIYRGDVKMVRDIRDVTPHIMIRQYGLIRYRRGLLTGRDNLRKIYDESVNMIYREAVLRMIR